MDATRALQRHSACAQVVVLTRAHGDRSGVRYMTGGLKVYYAPRLPLFGGTTLPGVLGLAPLVRCIVIRERITIVHGHTAFRHACVHMCASWRHRMQDESLHATTPRRAAFLYAVPWLTRRCSTHARWDARHASCRWGAFSLFTARHHADACMWRPPARLSSRTTRCLAFPTRAAS